MQGNNLRFLNGPEASPFKVQDVWAHVIHIALCTIDSLLKTTALLRTAPVLGHAREHADVQHVQSVR
jgi:hypothetical protein